MRMANVTDLSAVMARDAFNKLTMGVEAAFLEMVRYAVEKKRPVPLARTVTVQDLLNFLLSAEGGGE